MGKNGRRRTPAETTVSTLFQKESKTSSAYNERESKPWFDVTCCEAEEVQIDNYINERFKEFNDDELLQFLKTNSKFRNIVSDIRNVYVKTSGRKAA